jgi:hypothetical protein
MCYALFIIYVDMVIFLLVTKHISKGQIDMNNKVVT